MSQLVSYFAYEIGLGVVWIWRGRSTRQQKKTGEESGVCVCVCVCVRRVMTRESQLTPRHNTCVQLSTSAAQVGGGVGGGVTDQRSDILLRPR